MKTESKKRSRGSGTEQSQLKKQKLTEPEYLEEKFLPPQFSYSWLVNNFTRLMHCLENPKIMESTDRHMKEFATKVQSLLLNAKKELGYALHTEIILAGRVGIGKSTIINTLLGYDIAPSGSAARSLTRAIVKYKYWEGDTFLVKTFRDQKTRTSTSITTLDFIESKIFSQTEEVNEFLCKIFKAEDQKLQNEPTINDKEECEEESPKREDSDVSITEKIHCVEVYCNANVLRSGLVSLVDAPGYSYSSDTKFSDTTYRTNSVNNVEYWVVFDGIREQEDPTLWNFVRRVYSGMEVLQTNSICLVWHRFSNVLNQMCKEARGKNNNFKATPQILTEFKTKAKTEKLLESNKFLNEENAQNNSKEVNTNISIVLKEENLMCSYVDYDEMRGIQDVRIEELQNRVKLLEQRSKYIFTSLIENLSQLITPPQQSNFSHLETQLSMIFKNTAKHEMQPSFSESIVKSKLVFSKGYQFLRAAINGGGFFHNTKIRLDLQQEVIEIFCNSVHKYLDPILRQVSDCLSAESNLQPFKTSFENIINAKKRFMVEFLKKLVLSTLPPNVVQKCAYDSAGKKIKRETGFSEKIFLNFIALVKPISEKSFAQMLKVLEEMDSEIQKQLKSYSKGLDVTKLREIQEFALVEKILNTIKNNEFKYQKCKIPTPFTKLSSENGGRNFAESLLFCLNHQKREEFYNYVVKYCDIRLKHSRVHTPDTNTVNTFLLTNASLFEVLLMFDCYVFPTEWGLNKMCKKLEIKLEIIGDLLGGDTYRYFGDKESTTKVVLYYDAALCRFYPLLFQGSSYLQIDNPAEYTVQVSHTGVV